MIETFTFPSADGKTLIHAKAYLPEKPRAVVQVLHGMQEYFDRYAHYAEFLMQQGFAVFGHDHLGHGQSIACDENLGFFADKNGVEFLLADILEMNRRIHARFPDLPVALLAHSMGSILGRLYMARHGDTLNAVVLSGTVSPTALAAVSPLPCALFRLFLGAHARSPMLNRIVFGSYNKRFENPRTASDWLTTDETVVDRYLADPKCNYIFTVSAFADLAKMTRAVQSRRQKLLPTLPILLVSGDMDPCGNYGEGIPRVAQLLKNAGAQEVSYILYPGMRHELHNESCRESYMQDVSDWLHSSLNL